MKRIVLKPKLEEKEHVIFNNEEHIVVQRNSTAYLTSVITGAITAIASYEIDIIESPEEKDHLIQYNQRKEAVWDAVRLADHEYDEGNIPAVSRAEHIGHRALNALNGQEKKLEQVADAGKVIDNIKDLVENQQDVPPEFDKIFKENFFDILATDEKLALKLRVGGVYRRRDGEIEEMELHFRDTDTSEFKGKHHGCYYAENGELSWRHLTATTGNKWEVIEEVQEVQPAQKEKDAVEQKPKSRTRVVVQREIEEFNCEVEPHPTGQCDKCIPVQPSNPFKEGEKIIAYRYMDGTEEIIKGIVEEVVNNLLIISDNEYPEESLWVHYKQCERGE